MLTKIFPLFTLAASAAAQYVSRPHAISITGKTNPSINGYAASCHAGAAIEGLCYTTGTTLDDVPEYAVYYLNATTANGTTGPLVWNLPLGGPDDDADGVSTTYVPSALTMSLYNYGTNVATPLFLPGVGASSAELYVTVAVDGRLTLQGGYDDTANNATRPAYQAAGFGDLSNWVLCYQWTEFYYYYSVGWVYGVGPAQNPSCEAVDLVFEPISV